MDNVNPAAGLSELFCRVKLDLHNLAIKHDHVKSPQYTDIIGSYLEALSRDSGSGLSYETVNDLANQAPKHNHEIDPGDNFKRYDKAIKVAMLNLRNLLKQLAPLLNDINENLAGIKFPHITELIKSAMEETTEEA